MYILIYINHHKDINNTKDINQHEEDLLGSSSAHHLIAHLLGDELTSDDLTGVRDWRELQMVSYTLESDNIPSPYQNVHIYSVT